MKLSAHRYSMRVPMSEYVRKIRARMGHDLIMFPTVSAVVVNDGGEVLLGQRSDNRRWSLIEGMLDPGEQPADGIVREVYEETGVEVAIDRLAGVSLHQVTYSNGDLCHMVNTWFRCSVAGGEARVNDEESVSVRWFPLDRLPPLSDFAMLRIRTGVDKDGPAWFAPTGRATLPIDW